MKNFFAIVLLFVTSFFVSCQKEDAVTPISGVTISKTTLALAVGARATLTATVSPDNVVDKRVVWSSSNASVATVSENGEVVAVSAGAAVITVASVVDKSKTATCVVTITSTPIAVSDVVLNRASLPLLVGEKETLIATVLPEEITDKRVTWTSSNAAVATVSATGEVTALSLGTSTITATSVADNTKTATCVVAVTQSVVDVTGVTLNKPILTLTIGGKETLVSTVLPDDATDNSVAWASSNTAVATVSSAGEVTAIGAGSATITVASVDNPTKTATCQVTVTGGAVAVIGVTLNKQTLSLVVGGKETLVSTILPENAANKNVTWTSNNTAVATVSATGEVTAIGAGSATITVTSVDNPTKAATCQVTVTKPAVAVTLVGINNKPLSLLVGGKETLLVSVLPDNATDKSVKWTSNNTSVATVSSTGEVLAVGAGVAKITATSVSDNTKTDECDVTVTAPVVTTAAIGNYYYSDKTQSKIFDNTKTCLGVVFWVDPSNAQKGKIVSLDEKELEWSEKLEATGAINNTNGRSNMYQINQFIKVSVNSVWADYPAFNWVATVKNGRQVGGWAETDMWYLPAQGDLVTLFGGGTTLQAVNVSLGAVPGALVLTPGIYCSSTEKDDTVAISVSLSTGISQNIIKVSADRVRAVATF